MNLGNLRPSVVAKSTMIQCRGVNTHDNAEEEDDSAEPDFWRQLLEHQVGRNSVNSVRQEFCVYRMYALAEVVRNEEEG